MFKSKRLDCILPNDCSIIIEINKDPVFFKKEFFQYLKDNDIYGNNPFKNNPIELINNLDDKYLFNFKKLDKNQLEFNYSNGTEDKMAGILVAMYCASQNYKIKYDY